MSNFRLMTKSQQFLFWPSNASKVELSWKKITFELNELIGVIGIRYNGGTYCYVFPNNSLTGNWPHGECENDVFNIKTLNTIHHGRCYTIEFPQSVRFFGEYLCTLKSGIVVLVGMIVLVETFGRINKQTGGNKRTGGHFY